MNMICGERSSCGEERNAGRMLWYRVKNSHLAHMISICYTLANRLLFASICDRIQLKAAMIMARTANVFARVAKS